MPDLEPWHRDLPVRDFRAKDAGESFADYLAREDRLFDAVARSLAEVGARQPSYVRYRPDGRLNPANLTHDWNRSFEVEAAQPAGAVVLVHGLSDSPYSMRATAELFAERGLAGVGLRLPGHGTVPGALARAAWPDWREALRVAVRHARSRSAAGPLVLVGYSTGAALAVDYALRVAEGSGDPPPTRLVLLSPAIGVSPFAALARVPLHLSRLPGLAKLAWTPILPEYDPFK